MWLVVLRAKLTMIVTKCLHDAVFMNPITLHSCRSKSKDYLFVALKVNTAKVDLGDLHRLLTISANRAASSQRKDARKHPVSISGVYTHMAAKWTVNI